jgi:hypothetical protein
MKRILFLSVSAVFVAGLAANAPAVLADNTEGKVAVCHIPPGNPSNTHTIVVGESAVPAHLAHGDSIGECNSLPLPE